MHPQVHGALVQLVEEGLDVLGPLLLQLAELGQAPPILLLLLLCRGVCVCR
jgi:hypothetical protein